MITRPGAPSSQSPGAVPHRFGSTVAPRGTSAWTRLLGDGVRPSAANRSTSAAQIASSNSSGAAEQLGDDLLGDVVAGGAEAAGGDDGAGPRERSATPSRIAAGSSPTVVRRTTRTPTAASAARDLRAVGVDREAEQQLGADGEELDVHGEVRPVPPELTGRGRRTAPDCGRCMTTNEYTVSSVATASATATNPPWNWFH